ncbi:hypothetical protein ACTQ75_004640 [Vibrio alginolyticus]|uniref:hypothetical protein n=1 Tax=Vibrio TaxID=662 RepID=UPI00280DAC24|nr:hypothetical protein [Vibrio sp. Vb1980]EHZ7124047.1 hypothetical protein [Vibrio vulnificus]ELB2850152.1 hypothetical protein [Vibrio alginolyticus]EMA2429585.1 hypothetical protein [Vibrio alginolyticus]MDW1977416.1 hypothetical protein [Vibrio sp. Vb1980]
MKSKQIFHRVSGHDNESFIFLDKLDNGTYQVRKGTSRSVDHFNWEEESTTMSLEDFLANNEQYRPRAQELIAEFEAE